MQVSLSSMCFNWIGRTDLKENEWRDRENLRRRKKRISHNGGKDRLLKFIKIKDK
jgi:hypothetical protein